MDEKFYAPRKSTTQIPYEGSKVYGDHIPARIIVLGPSGQGKTWLIKNSILNPNKKNNPFWLDYDFYQFFSNSHTEPKPEEWKTDEWEVDPYGDLKDITSKKIQLEYKKILAQTPSKHGILVFDDVPGKQRSKMDLIGEYYRISRKLGLSLVSTWQTIKEVPDLVADNATLWVILNTEVGTGQLTTLTNKTKMSRKRLMEALDEPDVEYIIVNTCDSKIYMATDDAEDPLFSDE